MRATGPGERSRNDGMMQCDAFLFTAGKCVVLGPLASADDPNHSGRGWPHSVPDNARSSQENLTYPMKVAKSPVIGRITGEEGDILHVATNPSAPGQVTMVHQGNIQSRQVSPTSIMPPGLLNAMNPDEVADLLA